MSSSQTYPQRARPGLAALSLIGAALLACDDPADAPTATSSATAPVSTAAHAAAKKALIAFSSGRDGTYGLFVMTPDGRKETRLTAAGPEASAPAWSPDRTRLAFSRPFVGSRIYVMNADGTNLRQLTDDSPYGDQDPDWSPDGSRIAFQRNGEIVIVNADGTNPTVVPHGDLDVDNFPSWSPDGTKLAIARDRGGNQIEQVWVLNVDGTGAVQLTDGSFQNTAPKWSPDGSKIGFVTNRDVVAHVYVMNPDGTGQTRVTGAIGRGDGFVWSPDGTRMAVGAAGDIWAMNADGTEPVQLTDDPAEDGGPAWAP
jgi:Tol biopolymer transport system component